jgi:carbonic anhydrase|tara:strand:+ start:784 stop:1386 length:603 start_codon:yes stop_codon:yes gene_type:complete
MKTHTKEFQVKLTPETALTLLQEGNHRFVKNLKTQRNHLDLVEETSSGQYPFAVVLSCIDSRVPAELVFDQGIGDIFSVRVAGNIVNEDILGSIEYGCAVAGSKILIVLGHTKCGAVTAAYENVELGNITALLRKIKPAIETVKLTTEKVAIEDVVIENVRQSIKEVRAKSSILADLEKEAKIKIVGAIYNVETGTVSFI